jgi:hypothetical protein
MPIRFRQPRIPRLEGASALGQRDSLSHRGTLCAHSARWGTPLLLAARTRLMHLVALCNDR